MSQSRKREISQLVIATHNPGKLAELQALMVPFGVAARSAAEFGLAEPLEDAPDFVGNALIKARAACAGTGLPALSDDSGLVVPALGGAPGIYSARWAGERKDFSAAMARVEHELTQMEARDYRAHFVCALALVFPDGDERIYEGKVFGELVFPPRGKFGFGYDAIFRKFDMNATFGEIEPVYKHEISHRAEAFRFLMEDLFGADSNGAGESRH